MLTVRGALPSFFSVSTWTWLELPTVTLPNERLLGLILTDGWAVWVPTPERLTLWGLPGASSVMVTAPERVPVTDGVNVTLIAHEDDGEIVEQLFVCEKSPEAWTLLTVSRASPSFVSVSTWTWLELPTTTLPNERLLALILTDGLAVWVPTPEKLTLRGLPGASSVMVTAPERVPVTDGVNVTLIAHEDDGEMVEQLFVCEKSPEV